MRSAGLMGDAAVYMTILYCLAFAPFLLPAANDVGALTATSYEVMRVLVITASLARLGGSGHVVLGSFQWSKVGETRGFVKSRAHDHFSPGAGPKRSDLDPSFGNRKMRTIE